MLHGSGSPRADATESSVLRHIFLGAGPSQRMTPIKAMTCHTLGGRDLLSPLLAVLAVKEKKVPPVLILTAPIPETVGLGLLRGSPASGDPTHRPDRRVRLRRDRRRRGRGSKQLREDSLVVLHSRWNRTSD
ncbi:hypothetical protein [Streptomyces sp. NPDC091219]|uniref:hypothetical protein n=1 Tax=Streptomyces sp. NPDC091219 TaxID=3155193 RepID=UPI00344EFE00